MENLKESTCFACRGTGSSQESIIEPLIGLTAHKCLICDGRGTIAWRGPRPSMRELLVISSRENSDQNPL